MPKLLRLSALLTVMCAAALAAPAAHAGTRPDLTPPMQLPGAAAAASSAAWLVGAEPGAAAAALARAHGARTVGVAGTGSYSVPAADARAFAAALKAKGLLTWAQPNGRKTLDAVADDPLSAAPNNWRARVADPAVDPPPVTTQSPIVALVDAAADTTHPEFANDPWFGSLGGFPVVNLHGTATAAVAGAPLNGVGMLGVWPGARTLNVPLPSDITCADSANGINRAIQSGAKVLNMSYGSRALCMPEYIALQYATGLGIVLVAAGGNDGETGSPPEYPASLPHVLTVAAVGNDDAPAGFSNVSDAMDLSAPGVGILTAVPPALDTDGVPDGYMVLSGTSFAAPMVAAAAGWIAAARPDLRGDQIAQVVRLAARDVGPKGWDQNTGFGVLDVAAALQFKAPAHDPTEPNDNLVWVNGRAFSKPDAPIWRGGKSVTLAASVDRYEDPADVYRIVIPAGATAALSAALRYGDVELSAYKREATSLNDTRRRVTRSRTRGKTTERIAVTNRGSRSRTFYVVVRTQGTKSLDAGYVLRVR